MLKEQLHKYLYSLNGATLKATINNMIDNGLNAHKIYLYDEITTF